MSHLHNLQMPTGTVIYSGSKLFWRSRLNLDIQIISHPRFSCFEIVSYDSHSNTEIPRLYLDITMLKSHIFGQKEFMSLLQDKIDWADRHNQEISEEDMRKAVRLQLTIQYVLSYLEVNYDPEDIKSTTLIMHHSFNESEEIACEKPEHLVPAYVTPREMHSTYKNFVDVLNHILDDFHEIKKDYNLAAKFERDVADNLSPSSARYGRQFRPIKSAEQYTILDRRRKLQQLSFEDHPIAKIRWMAAIHQVILHNQVKAIRRRLARLAAQAAHDHAMGGSHIVAHSPSVFTSIQFPLSNPEGDLEAP